MKWAFLGGFVLGLVLVGCEAPPSPGLMSDPFTTIGNEVVDTPTETVLRDDVGTCYRLILGRFYTMTNGGEQIRSVGARKTGC